MHGAHPEMLVRRPDGRRDGTTFCDNPNEGLSAQHILELRDSGIECGRLTEERAAGASRGLFGQKFGGGIHKLAEEASGDGASIPLAELGENNLVFVTRHKGAGAEARHGRIASAR